MKFEIQFKEAIQKLKSNYNLPKSGFLSGGSIANTVWNLVSGKNAPINDIDIYRFLSIKETIGDDKTTKQNFTQIDSKFYEDYKGPVKCWKTTDFYVIEDVSQEGLINYIDYNSSTTDYQIILNSFDINCCQLGYDLESEIFYWTKEFIDFLETGELRLTNLTSPSHSAIRLVKKKNELGAILPPIEFQIIGNALGSDGLSKRFLDTTKTRFKQRYADMYYKYESELSSYFRMVNDKSIEQYLQSINCMDKIYHLIPHPKLRIAIEDVGFSFLSFFLSSYDFLFYVRNILSNDSKIGGYKYSEIWKEMPDFIDSQLGLDYFDIELSKGKMDFLFRLYKYATLISNNIKGLTLSHQWKIISKLFNYFKDDLIVAISILEYCKLKDVILDDDSLLLLELSVRKNILSDSKEKVKNILNLTYDKKDEIKM